MHHEQGRGGFDLDEWNPADILFCTCNISRCILGCATCPAMARAGCINFTRLPACSADRTSKMAKIKVWQLGLFYRAVQVGVLGYIIYTFAFGGQWANASRVTNSINAWVSSGSSASVDYSASYCSNRAYSYDFPGEGWEYVSCLLASLKHMPCFILSREP